MLVCVCDYVMCGSVAVHVCALECLCCIKSVELASCVLTVRYFISRHTLEAEFRDFANLNILKRLAEGYDWVRTHSFPLFALNCVSGCVFAFTKLYMCVRERVCVCVCFCLCMCQYVSI
jgi:hypothetical protein